MPGETGPIVNTVSLPIAMVIAGFFAIAVYNSIEIYISIFRTFRRRQGLYFWSAITANTGIPLVAISALLRLFGLAPRGPMSILYALGWWIMVTGQALVLYSRLNLVMMDPRKLRWLLRMIVGVFLGVQLPTSILFVFNNFKDNPDRRTIIAFDVIQKVQLAVFTIQESILSGLYVYEASRTLKLMKVIKGPQIQKLFHELMGLFVLVVALDISLIITQYTNHYQIQTTYKPVVYSIKLKAEAFVLNNLIALVLSSTYSSEFGMGPGSGAQRLGMTQDNSWWSQHSASVGVRGSMVGSENPTVGGGEALSPTPTGDGGMMRVPKKVFRLGCPPW
ncbi:hypothetical protein HD806DRAFT_550452 [Xylariaceae sp. AK1471]|nr:hypothetical protein HD806DRAFT_550452 [Xylariaceae sp. AK1471]